MTCLYAVLFAATLAPSVSSSGSCDANGAECDDTVLLQHQVLQAAITTATCQVGDHVACYPGAQQQCAGKQCCNAPPGLGGTVTCPSASVNHMQGCTHAKVENCLNSAPRPTPTPPPTPPPCDTSKCDGCSGTVCLTCRQDEEVKCCLDDLCRHCSGEQCTSCRNDYDNLDQCTPERCLDDACRHFSGDQDIWCRNENLDRCCSGVSPAVSLCPAPTPPTPAVSSHFCQVGSSVACFPGQQNQQMCLGNQCCLGSNGKTNSNGKTYTCPSANVTHMSGCTYGKVYDCTR